MLPAYRGSRYRNYIIRVKILSGTLIAILLAVTLILAIGMSDEKFSDRLAPDQAESAAIVMANTGQNERTFESKWSWSYGMALETRFEDLAMRADGGDADSACRLAWDLNLCASSERLPELENLWIEVAARAPSDSSAFETALQRAAAAAEMSGRADTICKGLTPQHESQLGGRLLQAALSGNTAAMARIALAPQMGDSFSWSAADMNTAYRDEALGFLERAAMSGEPGALMALFNAHSNGFMLTPAGELPIVRDTEKAIAAGLVLQQLADSSAQLDISSAFQPQEFEFLLSEAGTYDRRRVADLQAGYEKAMTRRMSVDSSSYLFTIFPERVCDA